MNFSAEKAGRKWPCGGLACGEWPMVTVAAMLLMLCALTDPAAAARRSDTWSPAPWSDPSGGSRPKVRRAALPAAVPLPKPRPTDAPAAPAASSPPPPSACRLALTEDIAIAPSIPDIHGPGDCGGEDLVQLEAIVLPDKHLVSVKPAAILRCPMASAITDWIRTDMAPLAANLGSVISGLDNFDSYECRSFNRIAG